MPATQIFYSGRVQGVGFRYTVKRIAMGYEVTGWIRNLADGRVEMQVMAADQAELAAFLGDVEVESPLTHLIKATKVHSIPPLAGVTGFSIVS